MTPVITIAYRPGGYGSYLSWVIDRFNKFRMQHEPHVTGNPFLADGSSHGYVSHCKIETEESFVDGYIAAAKLDSPWDYNIYAGWPKGSISKNVNHLLEIMGPHDRIILIECRKISDHMLRWVRNEATMDKHRWWNMYGITSESQYEEAFEDEWLSSSRYRPEDIRAGIDPRMFVLDISDILEPKNSWRQILIHDFLRWPMVDKDLYMESSKKFHKLQEPYTSTVLDMLNIDVLTQQGRDRIEASLTPVQRALVNVQRRRKGKGSLWI